MVNSREIEGRRTRNPKPLFLTKTESSGGVATGVKIYVDFPANHISKIKGLHVVTGANQTIQGVYLDDETIAANRILPAYGGGVDIELSLNVAGVTVDFEDVFGECYGNKKLIVVYNQAVGAENCTLTVYGHKREIMS